MEFQTALLPEETIEEAKIRLKRELLMCEGFALPVTDQDVQALQVQVEDKQEEHP